jgi:putative transposase
MQQFLPGFVKRGLKAVGSRLIDWLREWIKPDHHGLVGGAVADATRSKLELMLENALLRQQLIVLERQVKRPPLSWRERGIMVLLASKLPNWKVVLFIVQPDTLLRWHRDLFRLVWRRKSQPKRQGGRRPLPGRVVQCIRRMTRENPLWGAERIRGEMLKLNTSVAKSSVQKYTQDLRRAGPSGQSGGRFCVITHQRSGPVISCSRMMLSFAASSCS